MNLLELIVVHDVQLPDIYISRYLDICLVLVTARHRDLCPGNHPLTSHAAAGLQAITIMSRL